MNKQNLIFALILLACPYIAWKLVSIPSRLDFVIFFTVLTIIPIIKKPSLGLYLLLTIPLFIPFIRRVFFLFSSFTNNDLLLLIPDIILALLVLVLFDKLRKREKILVHNTAVMKIIWIYIFYYFAHSFFLSNVGVMKGLFSFKFTALYMLTFFFAIYFINTKKMAINVFYVLFSISIIAAIYALKQVYIGYSHFEEIWFIYIKDKFTTLFINGVSRPFSILSSPACLADLMIMGAIAAVVLSKINKSIFSFLFLLGIPLFIWVGLWTSVRSNWFGFIAGVPFWIFLGFNTSKIKVFITIALILSGFFGIYLLTEKSNNSFENTFLELSNLNISNHSTVTEKSLSDIFIKERVNALTNPLQEHSMKARFVMWGLAISYATSAGLRGFFGFGPGSFDAHSYYFSTLTDLGFPGLFLLLSMLFIIFKVGFKSYYEEEDYILKTLIRGWLTLFMVFCIVNLTGTHVSSHPADIYFWLFSGLIISSKKFRAINNDLVENNSAN